MINMLVYTPLPHIVINSNWNLVERYLKLTQGVTANCFLHSVAISWKIWLHTARAIFRTRAAWPEIVRRETRERRSWTQPAGQTTGFDPTVGSQGAVSFSNQNPVVWWEPESSWGDPMVGFFCLAGNIHCRSRPSGQFSISFGPQDPVGSSQSHRDSQDPVDRS